ncbi:MAG: TIGR02206 family membrane protein [Propionibacteriaceae bacterium]|jgi:hypothetical integral membrane protein (TIGR02206 family)|nr:TIGR02206 family membrane protein [Propionibacteriaceae bacterium]
MDSLFDIMFTRQISSGWRWRFGDPAHLTYIALCTVAAVWALWALSRMSRAQGERALRWLAGAVFTMWIIPPVLMCLTDTGERWIDHLPLHLCSSACIIIPVAILTRNQVLLNYSFGLSFPGAVAAILTPGEMYRSLSWAGVHYFLFNFSHLLLIVAGLGAIAVGVFRPRWRYYPAVIGVGLALMVVAYPVNKWLGSNYMFVNWAEPGTILETFADLAGTPGYVFLLIAMGAVVVALLYAIWSVVARLSRPRPVAP